MNPRVLYEDNHIIVSVKPNNLLSQADGGGDADILTAVKEYVRYKYDKPGEAYIGLVHRLDRPAGGIMVFARTSKAAARLSESIRKNLFEKRYLAVIDNKADLEPSDTLRSYLFKDKKTNTVRSVPAGAAGAKYAELNYRIAGSSGAAALAEILLKTGRSHQIRVQMSDIGAPLYGDYRYGGKKGCDLALWAYSLKFVHPVKKEEMTFMCPPPDNFPWTLFRNEINNLLNQ